MPDSEAAFAQAIDANPDDDLVRLAFADWLEDRGDPRAVPIRARCEQVFRIKEKLALLAGKDRHLKYFAAHSHQYQMLPALPVPEVRALEATYGIRFPDDYTDFAVRIAEEGAGPSYGVHPVRSACHEGMALEFPFDPASDPEADSALGFDLPEEVRETCWVNHFVRSGQGGSPSFAGCIALSCHGCGSDSYLVITGKERGVVWDYYGAGDGLWHPTGQSFLPWYESWLDAGLRQFKDVPSPVELGDYDKLLRFRRERRRQKQQGRDAGE